MKKKYILYTMSFLTIFVSCHEKNLPNISAFNTNIDKQIEQAEVNQMTLPSQEEIHAREIISSMSGLELAAQVLMTGIDGDEHLMPAMTELLEEIPAGAVMLFKYNLSENTETIKSLLDETASLIKESGKNIAPFIAVDHEGGIVHRFSDEVTRLPAPRSYWEKLGDENREAALEELEADAFFSGQELAYLGINMNLAPIAEIENAENSFFLGSRSYGPDADFTRDAVSAFSDGMIRAGVLPVLKHFPGSSGVDPHTGIAVLGQNREELDAMVMPFREIIQSGNARAMMISHSIVPELDAGNNGSLSSIIIQDWLCADMGFNGIIIADDFSMSAVTSRGITPEEAVIKALNAGVNIVMVWPKGLRKTLNAILTALEDGTLSRETLASRAEKIIIEKIKRGVIPIETNN